jgi:hypothetical protein
MNMKLERIFAIGANGLYMASTYLNLEGNESPNESFSFDSDGENKITTNYFDAPSAHRGFFFLVRAACTDHLLIPDSQLDYIDEMKSGAVCIITKRIHNGHDCLEIIFDDRSTTPFALNVSFGLCSLPLRSRSAPFKLAAWTREGKVGEWTAHQRTGKKLPNREPQA